MVTASIEFEQMTRMYGELAQSIGLNTIVDRISRWRIGPVSIYERHSFDRKIHRRSPAMPTMPKSHASICMLNDEECSRDNWECSRVSCRRGAATTCTTLSSRLDLVQLDTVCQCIHSNMNKLVDHLAFSSKLFETAAKTIWSISMLSAN